MAKPKFQFPSVQARATAYGTYKYLERLLKEDGQFDPGFEMDLSGQSLTMVLPPGTRLTRSLGTDGQGHDFHTASTNLNGFAVLTLFIRVCLKFNQWFSIKRPLIAAIKAAIKTKTMGTEDKLVQAEPDLAAEIEAVKTELTADLPKRKQDTVRDMTYSDLPPTLVYTQSKLAA